MKNRRRTSVIGEPMFKLIVIGDAATGKSSLVMRYINDKFIEEYNVTVGVEFVSHRVKIDENCTVKLQIWDTAGQQSFRCIIKSFYRNSSAVVLTYNITKMKSFESLNEWYGEARQNAPNNAIYILVGTHLDLQEDREVDKSMAEKWTKQNGISMFFETSAKTSLNVNHAFEEIAKQLFLSQINKRKMKLNSSHDNTLVLNDPKLKKPETESKCC